MSLHGTSLPTAAEAERIGQRSDATLRSDGRRILRLFAPYRGQLLLVLVLILLAAVSGVITPFLVRDVVDVALPERDMTLLVWCVIAMVLVSIASSAFTVVQTMISTRVGQAVMNDLRVGVYAHLQKMGLQFFSSTRTGEVQSRIFSDIGSMQAVVTSVITSIVSSAAVIAVSALSMLLMDWRLFLFSLITTPLAAWLNRIVGRRRRRIVRQRQEMAADLGAYIQESLSVSGILLSTTLGRGTPLTRFFAERSQRLADLEVASAMAGRWLQGTFQVLLWVMPALTYLLGGWLLIRGGADITVGTLVAFVNLQLTLFPQVNSLLRTSAQVNASLALFPRVFDYLDLPIPIQDPPNPVDLRAVPAPAGARVEFDRVDFSYPNAERPAVNSIDITVEPGRHVALVGATGSGKTTIGYLLSRLYDVTAGAVRINGVDVREASRESIAAMIGQVTQETYLLHDTVAANLRFAKEDASDEELIRACRIAHIHEHIAALPRGYDTIVGERGYRFSGGEKQRLAIARTILRDPPILLLDEATSALDAATERSMAGALRTLSRGRTTISIAHRLSTIRHADEIVVLHKGRIVERGSSSQLTQAGGVFAGLVAHDAAASD